jgi:hypothetical protein
LEVSIDMKANRSIGCNVTECRFHAKSEPLCSLENIQVSRNGKPTAQEESDTECASFEKE